MIQSANDVDCVVVCDIGCHENIEMIVVVVVVDDDDDENDVDSHGVGVYLRAVC
jgi:hypothetical protein